MAEAMYGVPEEIRAECRKRLPEDMLEVLDRFQRIVAQRKDGNYWRENQARNRYRFEKTGPNRYIDNRRIKPEYCHAFINNIAFPKSLEEIKDYYIAERGMYDIEDLLASEETCWTAPRWAMRGDHCGEDNMVGDHGAMQPSIHQYRHLCMEKRETHVVLVRFLCPGG